MDLNHKKFRRVVKEDRLSSLPDELIHKILSSFDMKFVVQTSLLSSKWKLLWTTMPCLNFESWDFDSLPKFDEFVTHVLSHRNPQLQVSSVELHFRASPNQLFVRKIADYAFSHIVQQLNISSDPKHHLTSYPPCLFNSQSLKHFTLMGCYCKLKTPLQFPALKTLHLSQITLCDENSEKSVDLFSKCVNLKNLTLEHFFLGDVEVLDIITPRLSNLILINGNNVKVVNLIAPQLENLTISSCSIEYMNAPPGLSSLYCRNYHPMQLCKDGFLNLNKVKISLYMCIEKRAYKEENARKIINMLQELHSARYLTLSFDIVECISSFPDLLLHHPSPFNNLICMTLDSNICTDYGIEFKVKMSVEARNFLFGNSPNCKFIMDIPGAVLTE